MLAQTVTSWVELSNVVCIIGDPYLFTCSNENLEEMWFPFQPKHSLMLILLN